MSDKPKYAFIVGNILHRSGLYGAKIGEKVSEGYSMVGSTMPKGLPNGTMVSSFEMEEYPAAMWVARYAKRTQTS